MVGSPNSDSDERGVSDPERLLAELGATLCARIVAAIPDWVEREVDRILDAWAAAGAEVDRTARTLETRQAAGRAAADVTERLQELLSADVDAQSTTPLAIVRGAVAYPTGVLLRAGVPPVVRDAFDEERFPDDAYGLTPASLGAVDPGLIDPARAWGAAKAMAHKARHGRPGA
ncbi:MAG TPA: hypothetical protein VIJ09_02970 [Acidimicrobiales bacterium]